MENKVIKVVEEAIAKKKQRRKKKRVRKPRNKVLRQMQAVNKNRGEDFRKEMRELKLKQAAMESMLTKDIDPKYAKYMLCVMDPSNHLSKMPDSYSTPVALYKSVKIIPINIDFASNTNGQFAILVKPNIGNVTPNSSGFQIMYSKPGIADINDNSQYIFTSDPQVETFNSGLGGEWYVEGYTGATVRLTDATEYLTKIYFQPLVANLTSENGGLAVVPEELATTTAVGFLTYNSRVCSLRDNSLNVIYGGMSGWHMVSTYGNYPGGNLQVTGLSYFAFCEVKDNNNLIPIFVSGAGIPGYVLNDGKFVSYSYDNYTAVNHSASQGLLWRENFFYNFDSTKKYLFAGTSVSVVSGDTGSQTVTFVKVNAPPGSESNSNLFIPTLRPVAQSAILTNVTPQLYKGGVLACMSMVKGETQYFTNPSTEYNFRTIAGIGGSNADVSHRLNTTMDATKGAYTFWLPYQNVTSPNITSVVELNKADNGGIVFCGNVPAQSGVATVFYLKVVTVFEYTTQNRLIETKPYVGDQTKLAAAMEKIMSSESIIFENPSHLKKIQEAILSCLSPIYGISKLTGTDPKVNYQKFGNIAGKLLSSIGNGESALDLIPTVLAAL